MRLRPAGLRVNERKLAISGSKTRLGDPLSAQELVWALKTVLMGMSAAGFAFCIGFGLRAFVRLRLIACGGAAANPRLAPDHILIMALHSELGIGSLESAA